MTRASDRTLSYTRLARRGAAALLLGLVLFPWYRLVAMRAAGPAVDQTMRLGQLYYANLWMSTALALGAVLLLSSVIRPTRLASVWRVVERALLRPSPTGFGLALGASAGAISLWVSLAVLSGRPILLDGVAQLLQGRYLAGGRLAGPPLEDGEFWQFQFMVLSERGWASQYPPAFAAVLAAGQRAGVPWLVGPILLGVAVALTARIAERLFPDDPVVARIGALLLALSPVLAFHAAAYMSHVLALALAAAAVLASLRALDGSRGWSLAAGGALGGAFATRPYTALILGLFAVFVVWIAAPRGERPTPRAWASHLTAAVTGAAPFVIATLAYNRHFFGSPLRFGYEAAEGPGHRLGFHVDPWGNPYGLLEAIGYTSADLQGLSVELLQAPLPIVVLIGLWLVVAPRLGAGTALAAVWALLPVAAHALYWHHDLFMGPRLLYEALPGWCLLTAAAAAGCVRALPERGTRFLRTLPVSRSGVAATFVLFLAAGVVYAGPRKLASYRAEGARSGMTAAAPAVERATLVFVHGSWEDRIAARLAALGMRVDSIRSALANNSTCRLELHVGRLERDAEAGAPTPPGRQGVRFRRTDDAPLQESRMPSGSVIRHYPNEALDPSCEREAASDFGGVMGVPPLLWQGDLPGLGTGGAMFVRDFGPERNRRLIARFPGREPRVLIRVGEGAFRLLPYDEGMAALWSVPSASAPSAP